MDGIKTLLGVGGIDKVEGCAMMTSFTQQHGFIQ